jgi:hypothetical protein
MDQPAATQPARPNADWARAAEGIQLAGIAVFLLMNTMGVLPWSFWVDAIALWPVLIMSAGVRIAFEKTRAPWLLLIGPVLVLGSLAWVASGSRLDVATGPWQQQRVARPEGTSNVELAADLFGTRLQVESAANLPRATLVDGRSLSGDAGARIAVEKRDDDAQVRLKGGHPRVFFLPGRRQRWELQFPAELPLRFRVNGVMVRSRIDLSRGSFTGGRLEGVFLATDLRLPTPSAPQRIKVGGVFNSLTLTVPEGTPVRVHGPGLPFNALDRGGAGTPGRPGYEVNVEGIFTAVDVLTEPAPADASPTPAAPAKAEAEPSATARPRPEAEQGPAGRPKPEAVPASRPD